MYKHGTSIYFLLVLAICLLPHCSKRTNHTKLAVNYYKMSTAELEAQHGTIISYRQALQYIDKAIKHDVRAEYVAHKATLLFLLGNQEGSLLAFKCALKLPMAASVKSEVLNNYACLIARRGERKKALQLFEQLEQDEDYLTPQVALVNQAKIYYEKSDYRSAKQKLVYAVSIAPDYIDAHYYLGLTCYVLREYLTALKVVERTIYLDPEHAGAARLQNMVLAKCRDDRR